MTVSRDRYRRDPYLRFKETCWREVEALEERFERGEIDEAHWQAGMAALAVPRYLAADTPWGQSGKTGGSHDWEQGRSLLAEAIDRPGTFLDIGCANGYLMECLARWCTHRIEPYGVEISPELAELAKRRLPHWSDRIFCGNAFHWSPPWRFTYVRSGLYVPERLGRQYVQHLLTMCERLIIGVYSEEAEDRVLTGTSGPPDWLGASGFGKRRASALPAQRNDEPRCVD
jgi:hypothetical protein